MMFPAVTSTVAVSVTITRLYYGQVHGTRDLAIAWVTCVPPPHPPLPAPSSSSPRRRPLALPFLSPSVSGGGRLVPSVCMCRQLATPDPLLLPPQKKNAVVMLLLSSEPPRRPTPPPPPLCRLATPPPPPACSILLNAKSYILSWSAFALFFAEFMCGIYLCLLCVRFARAARWQAQTGQPTSVWQNMFPTAIRGGPLYFLWTFLWKHL